LQTRIGPAARRWGMTGDSIAMPYANPQRIIAEAVRLLELTAGLLPDEEEEEVINNITELKGLSDALWRDGIHRIQE
jgi:hypothetical protein